MRGFYHHSDLAPGVTVTLERVGDLGALGREWRGLEGRAAGSFFFQGWTWVSGVAAGFDDPVVLRAERGGVVVGLGVLNRGATRWGAQTLWFGESGVPALDRVFVEHNGPLVAAGETGVLAACMGALLRAPVAGEAGAPFRRVVLSGVDEAGLAAAQAWPGCFVRQTRMAPFVDLAAIGTPEDAMSASTRAQVRRARRLYEAEGPLTIARAATVAQALDWFGRLVALHGATWARRGQPGAFADARVLAFHRDLIGGGVPRGEVDLLRVTAGAREVGYLYNFRWRDRVYAYQSGFQAPERPQLKPGLVCHSLAIAQARAAGLRVYDFLAGDDRYKMSLATGTAPMHWLELARPGSPRGAALWLAGLIERQRRGRSLARGLRSAAVASDSMSASAPGGRPESDQAAPRAAM